MSTSPLHWAARLNSSLQVIGRHHVHLGLYSALPGIGPEGSALLDLVLHTCVHCAGYTSVADCVDFVFCFFVPVCV